MPDRTRNFELELNSGIWTINDRLFDTNFVMADPELNSTEEWTFFNTSPQPHALHIHDVDWRLTERSDALRLYQRLGYTEVRREALGSSVVLVHLVKPCPMARAR